jgi:hypothetical protein
MNDATPTPTSGQVRARMQACREELTALKRLLRAVEAAEQAEAARGKRREFDRGVPTPTKEGRHRA